jgi:hypothetical protein
MNIFLKICMICIAGTIAVPATFGQYYFKMFFEDKIRFGRGFSVLEESRNRYMLHGGITYDSSKFESNIFFSNTDKTKTEILKDFDKIEEWTSPSSKSIKFDGNYYYYLTYDIYTQNKNPDSVGWNFGVLDRQGNQIVRKKIYIKPKQALINQTLSLEFVKNNEIILWGAGIPPYNDPQIWDPYLMWIRLKKDGTQVSGPNYYKLPNVVKPNYATDSKLDIDSNMVVVYDGYDAPKEKYILKIKENDSIETLVRIPYVAKLEQFFAKVCVTHDGHFIVSNHLPDNKQGVELIKVNRDSKIIWKQTFDLLSGDYLSLKNALNTRDLFVSRIIETQNGDIVICGGNSVVDDFYIPALGEKVFTGTNLGSFMARFTKYGQLLWRHFLVNMDATANELDRVRLKDVIESADGSLVFAGDYGVSINPTKFVPFMMKVGPNGCFDDRCSHVDKYWYFPKNFLSSATVIEQDEPLLIYPNPGRDVVKLQIPLSYQPHDVLQYMVRDIKGQILIQGVIESGQPEISTRFLPSGMYIISLMDDKGKLWHGKWVKE